MEELGSRPSRAALVERGCKGALLFTDYELTTVVDTVIMLLDSKCGKETASMILKRRRTVLVQWVETVQDILPRFKVESLASCSGPCALALSLSFPSPFELDDSFLCP